MEEGGVKRLREDEEKANQSTKSPLYRVIVQVVTDEEDHIYYEGQLSLQEISDIQEEGVNYLDVSERERLVTEEPDEPSALALKRIFTYEKLQGYRGLHESSDMDGHVFKRISSEHVLDAPCYFVSFCK
jgi:hypothetical protein